MLLFLSVSVLILTPFWWFVCSFTSCFVWLIISTAFQSSKFTFPFLERLKGTSYTESNQLRELPGIYLWRCYRLWCMVWEYQNGSLESAAVYFFPISFLLISTNHRLKKNDITQWNSKMNITWYIIINWFILIMRQNWKFIVTLHLYYDRFLLCINCAHTSLVIIIQSNNITLVGR